MRGRVAAGAGALLWLAGCATALAAAAAGPRFVVTGHPLAAIVGEVGRGRAEVINLVPAGASPHTFEPRPSELAAAGRSSGLFFVSPLLDGWAAHLPAPVRIEVLPMVPRAMRLPNLETHGHEPGAGPGDDPHFWTDPMLVRAALPEIAAAMCRLDAPGCEAYRANAARFADELERLDREIAVRLAPVRGRAVVLFHPSFQYFLKRYGLTLAGVVEPSPGKEPTPRYLQETIATIRRANVRAVFGEPQLPRRAVEVVAEAAGIPVFTLDPMGGVPGRQSYAELLDYNARVLLEALR